MLTTLLALSLSASAGDFGLGIALGSPSGLTLKWFTGAGDGGGNAVDLLVGETWNNGWDSYGLMFSGDYLFTLGRLAHGDAASLDLYAGPGVNVWFNGYGYEHNGYGYGFLALELPVGLSVMLHRAPFEFFFEVAPMAVVLNNFGFAVSGALGARFYF